MNEYQIIEFKDNNIELSVNVPPNEETVWLTKDQMAILFDRDRTVISKHINNIYREGELDKESTCAKNAHMGTLGVQNYIVELYNLDVVISVGYRVKSKNGTIFRKWANSVLKEFLLKGYVINENRTLITDENYISLIKRIDSIDSRLHKIEDNEQYYRKEKLIIDGEIFDGVSYLEGIVSNANNKILLIDPYVDSMALNVLKNIKDNVIIRIITSSKAKLSNEDISLFKKQYNKSIKFSFNNSFHDRYLFIDEKVFHLGSSINYLGNKLSQISEVEDLDIINYLRMRVEY